MDGRILPCLGGSGKKAPEKANLPDHPTGFFMGRVVLFWHIAI